MKSKSHSSDRRLEAHALWRILHSRVFAGAAALMVMLSALLVFSGTRTIKSAEEEPLPQIYMNCESLIGTSQNTIKLQMSGYSYKQAQLRIVRVDLLEMLTLKDLPDSDQPAQFKSAEMVKDWSVDLRQSSGAWVNGETSFQNPGPGVYFIYATAGKVTRYLPFIVTDIAVVSKRDGDRTVLFVTNRFTGTAVNKAEVLTMKDESIDLKAMTGKDGLAELPIKGSDSVPVIARWKGHVAFMNMYNWYGDYFEGYKIYTVTDRPVYRPGHVVNYKATIRFAQGNVYSLPDKIKDAEIEIKDSKDNTVVKEKKELDGFGAVSGSFTLGEEPPVGQYNVIVRAAGQESWQSFQVDEYRKPEFEVMVAPDRDRVLLGDKVTFNVDVKYYFGEPVKDADVEYDVTAAPVYSWWYGWSRYSWYYDDEPYSYSYGGDFVTSGEAKTDQQGKLSVTVETNKAGDYDLQYTLTARVTDKSRREIAGAGSAKATRAEFNMYLDTDRYMYKPADTIKISAMLNDHGGNPVTDKNVDFTISLVTWDYDKNYERHEDKIFEKSATSNSQGKANIDFVPDRAGYFTISAVTRDSKGNRVAASTSAYAMDNSSSYAYWGGGGMEIVMDKDAYAVGDTARALITGGRGGVVLVSLEADRIYDYNALELKDGSALYEFKITEEMQPNVYLTTSMVQNNSYDTQTTNIVVPPDDKFLTLEIIMDKTQYKPGENATFTVKATDKDGKPVADTDLSLGIVDESIYALQPENIPDARQFFYGRRWNKVNTNCSLWEMQYRYGDLYDDVSKSAGAMDMVMAEEAMPAPTMARKEKSMAKKDGDGEAYAEAKIRADFRDTAGWYANLVTDKDGIASVTLAMPDSLTTWRATARGITRDTKVGNTTGKTLVRKNLLVRLETPRFFTQDDAQNITAVVHNYLSTEKKVKCILNVKGLKLKDGSDKYIQVPAGGDVRVEWQAIVEDPQDAWVTVKALTDEESDAMQLTIPVLPHGIQRSVADSGEADKDKVTAKLTLPKNSIPGATKLRLSFAPSIAAAMFESLDYLVGYPYGCVEQTMSRFLPDIIVQQAMQKLNLPLSDKLKELPKMVQQGHDRLMDMQHDDGGWGWWKNDSTHPYMTAYVIFGLSNAIKADFPVNVDSYERGIEALKNLIDKESDQETLAYMLFALDASGQKLPEKRVNEVLKNYKKLNAYSQALMAIVMEHAGNHDRALEIIRNLEKHADKAGPLMSWTSQRPDHWGWMDNDIETTAFVLKAIMAVEPNNDGAAKVVRYLVSHRNGDHWYSTKDTAAAVLALTDYMVIREDMAPALDFAVKVNGKQVFTGKFSGKDVFLPAATITLDDIKDGLKAGDNVVEISRSGKGKLYYTARLEWFSSEEKIQEQNNGVHVSRYYSFDEAGKKKLSDKSQIKPGDEIYVHINVIPKGTREYVIIEDMLPSGFEVVKEEQDYPYYYYDWRWWYPQKEIRDDKVCFFATSMYHGETYELSYRIRAEVPGTVSALPARAWLMYFPELGGHSDEHQFNVIQD